MHIVLKKLHMFATITFNAETAQILSDEFKVF
jgi:hypothetical protein